MEKPKMLIRKKKPTIQEKIVKVRRRTTVLSVSSENLKSIAAPFLAPSSFPNKLSNNSAVVIRKTEILMTKGKRAVLSGHLIALMITQAEITIMQRFITLLPLNLVRFTEILLSKSLLNKGIEGKSRSNEDKDDDFRSV